jgi:rubrerythrin
MRLKKKAGQLPPQHCPHCQKSLKDPAVPRRYARYAEMFGTALERMLLTRGRVQMAVWECPHCGHRWLKHVVAK